MKPEENPFIEIPLSPKDLQQEMTINIPTLYACMIIRFLNLNRTKNKEEQEIIEDIINTLTFEIIQNNKRLKKEYLENES